MEDLRFYDYEFNLICIQPVIVDVVWELKYNGVGTFEASFPLKSKLAAHLTGKDYIVVVQGEKQAIITEKRVEGNKFVLFGRTMNFILTKRIITPFNIKDCGVENKAFKLINKLVAENIPEIEVKLPEYDEEINFYRIVMYNLEEVICDITDKLGFGHSVVYDIPNKKWRLEFSKRRETNMLLSEENNNLYNTTYKESVLDYANCGVYQKFIKDCGDWDPELNDPFLVMGNEDNLGKMYKVTKKCIWNGMDLQKNDYIACINPNGNFQKTGYITDYYLKIDTDKKGLYKWETELSGYSEKEAQKSLETKDKEKEIRGIVRKLSFKRDYNLGDIVRVQKKIGNKIVDEKKLINRIQIWYESESHGERPYFKEVKA